LALEKRRKRLYNPDTSSSNRSEVALTTFPAPESDTIGRPSEQRDVRLKEEKEALVKLAIS
jgi:hypothetical protein